MQDLPDRNSAEDEGLWRHQEDKGVWREAEGGERKEELLSEGQRSSVSGRPEADSERRARTRSMALFSARRHWFTLRKLWT